MSRQVVVVEPGQGDRVGNVEFLARTVDTPFFNLSEVVLRPGQGVESHVHRGEDDSWLVLDGMLSVVVGEDARRIEAGPGTFVLVPSGTPHELRNHGSTDVRFLNVHAPGGFDRRIGWRPRRRHGVLATGLALLTVLLLTAGGPASAAGLTKAKVQQIAAQVLRQQAPTLSVAHATTAERADEARTADTATSASDAAKLSGLGPSTYLDRVAVSDKGGSATTSTTPVPVVEPVALVVPPGVEALRISGVAAFQGEPGKAQLYAVVDSEQCTGSGRLIPGSFGASAPVHQSVTLDRVVAVTPGAHVVTLCGQTVQDSQRLNPVLVVETIPDLVGEAPAY